jgi:hypothetical protein
VLSLGYLARGREPGAMPMPGSGNGPATGRLSALSASVGAPP